MWSSDTELYLLEVVAHFLMEELLQLKILPLGLPVIWNHLGIEQVSVLLILLKDYGIDHDKFSWFVLDNTRNNDTTLEKLFKSNLFDLQKKRLRCAKHIINLAAHFFLHGQNLSKLESKLRQDWSDVSWLELWKQRRLVKEFLNLVFYITWSTWRSAIFTKYQENHLSLADYNRIYLLVQDGGVC